MQRMAFVAVVLSLLLSLLALAPAADAGVIVVSSTIQAAVNSAKPGDKVRIPAGIYNEAVFVKKDNITIEAAAGAIMDGGGLGTVSGIHVEADGGARIKRFKLTGIQIRNYKLDGVFLKRVDNFQIKGGTFSNNSDYGVFPVLSSHGSIEGNLVSGAQDTGIYVGQSSDVEVGHNIVRDNTVGIDIEVSEKISAHDNIAESNALGIISQVIPGLVTTATADVRISDNIVIANNHPNPSTDPADFLTVLPSGVGILDVGGKRVIIRRNTVLDNNSGGIAVVALPAPIAALDPRINPLPQHDEVRDNIVTGNGLHPDPKLAVLGFVAVDLFWDTSGTNNCWSRNVFTSSFPSPLPACH